MFFKFIKKVFSINFKTNMKNMKVVTSNFKVDYKLKMALNPTFLPSNGGPIQL